MLRLVVQRKSDARAPNSAPHCSERSCLQWLLSTTCIPSFSPPHLLLPRAQHRQFCAASHVGPVANSAETYPWYALPFCRPEGGTDAQADFGDGFSGDRKVITPYVLTWKKDIDSATLCKQILNEDDIVRLVRRKQRVLRGATGSRTETSIISAVAHHLLHAGIADDTSMHARADRRSLPPARARRTACRLRSRRSGTASSSWTTCPCGSTLASPSSRTC